MNLILLGAPGSGKGTMAETLVKECKLIHISTGDIFRSNIKNATALGVEAKSYIDKGLLVPDEVTIKMVRDRLSNDDVKSGFMMDGFPRTLQQAEALDQILEDLGLKLDLVLAIDVPETAIVNRLAGRRVCVDCGTSYNVVVKPVKKDGECDSCQGEVIQRNDDKEDTILQRLKTYHDQTEPLFAYYEPRSIVKHLDNSGSFEESKVKLDALLAAL